MCGIAGFWGSGDRADLVAMTNALAHRGPDGEGFHCDVAQRVYLGHRRLAIRDLTFGHQPMWNEDGSVAVIYNGEIYNHAELRAELVSRGHRFATESSDTEVLVHGFEEWGDDLPRRLNGMFAFAIFDQKRRQLFLARDRFGEKPLYYAHDGQRLLFASELRGLLGHSDFAPGLSLTSLQKYFAYGYFPAPHTLYEGVRKLPGGCWLRLDVQTGQLRMQRYWQFLLAGVLAAAAAQLLVTWLTGSNTPTVGASGALFALLLAFGMLFPNRIIMPLFPPIPMKARTFVIVFGVLELLMGLWGRSGIAHFAHLGGMLGGYPMIRYWRSRGPFRRR